MGVFTRVEPELARLQQRFAELESQLADPAVAGDPARLRTAVSERARLEPTVSRYANWLALREERAECEELGPDYAELLPDLQARIEELEAELLRRWATDERDAVRSVVLEVRAGTGGDEAALWAGELLAAYLAFARRSGLKVEPAYERPSELGGLKEAVVTLEGDGAFAHFKFESGGHRVQRVPRTESQGRIHTSAATVAVLPVDERVEVAFSDSELRIDTFRSGGPGGQHANKTSSAIRVTHVPTGTVVICQDEKSQHRNKARALKVLQARLAEAAAAEQAAERRDARRDLVGSGDRSERVRTYNFPQSRVTDHRIGQSWHALDAILAGELEPVVAALNARDVEDRLAALTSGDAFA